ncbi:MAG TPA: 3-hydroxyacyl-ACP dehydratase FabZ [Bacillota bacterium]|nr:3-hydroxyacyl-ACP dehydratase FabZ [Bacillota bacterium]
MLNIEQIKELIPHRYPFLLVDKILELEPGKKAIGLKNVTINEPFFQGHFPEFAIMPGVLIIEALAQVGTAATLSLEENKGKLAFFAGIDNARFREQVRPGDTLTLEVELTAFRRGIGKGHAVAKVGEKVAAEADLMFAIGSGNK